ncbi:MAG: amidohydrolase, partial [Mucilaginibacter sp.]
ESLFSPENLAKIKARPMPQGIIQDAQAVIFTGGIIRPLINGSTDTVDAIGFADGIVVKSGTILEVREALALKLHLDPQVITLQPNQTLLPGLLEPHVHIIPTAMMANWVDVSPFNGQDLISGYSFSSVQSIITNALPNWNNVLLGTGLDAALLTPGSPYPVINNTVLDSQINSEKPMIILSASGHTLYLNTAGYTYVYNNSDALQKLYSSVDDYISDTNGVLEEAVQMQPAMETVRTLIIEKGADVLDQLTAMFQQANSRGVTFMYDALMMPEYFDILYSYMSLGNRPIRVGAAKYCASAADVSALDTYSQPSDYKDIYYGHVKIVSDGSNQGLTGFQSEPYLCAPDSYGVFDIPPTDTQLTAVPQEYQDLLNTAIQEKKWPLMIHANGDQAVSFALTAYQNAIAGYTGEQLRHRIEHCSLLDTATDNNQPAQMYTLGISPSFLIGHVGYWGQAFQNVIFGPEKTQMLDVCQSALNANLRITLHSDHSVTPLGPLRMMEQSITRIMEANSQQPVLNSAECLSPQQALIAVTNDAAWQCYAEQWVGCLDDNYFADFVILDTDPLSMTQTNAFMSMRNITVYQTWVKGVPVYPVS